MFTMGGVSIMMLSNCPRKARNNLGQALGMQQAGGVEARRPPGITNRLGYVAWR